MTAPPPLSVVFYLSDFQSGGTEWFALRLARGLKQKGITPVFLATQSKGELLPCIRQEFEVVTLGASSYRLLNLFLTLPSTIRFLKQCRPDVVISGLPLLNLMAALAKKLSGVPFRLIVVEHMRFSPLSLRVGLLKQIIKHSLVRFYQKTADDIICVSQTVWRDLLNIGAHSQKRAQVIPNPIIPDDVDQCGAQKTDHPWLNPKMETTLLAIGRLLPVKDYPTLLRAFARVLETKPARLIILGEGTERPKIEALIRSLSLQEHVSLKGSTPNVFPYLQAADLFVLSSTSEAFGNVVAEALACGTPVVSTDCGGPREILEDGRYGALVPVGNVEALAQALLAALAAPVDRAALMARGRAFSVQASVESYAALLRQDPPA